MIIRNITQNNILASNCSVADRFTSRFMGLMGRAEFPKGSGLLITPCNSIHMFFMKIPLDVVFITKDNTVIHLIEGIKPWQVSKIVRKAHSVLELPQGTIGGSGTVIGDKLKFEYG